MPLGSKIEMAGALLLLLYFIAGVIYSACLAPVPQISDAEEYLKLSYNLLHGPGYSMDGVHLTAGRPPGYAFFLAFVRSMDHGFLGIRLAQFLLLAGTIFLVYRVCSEKKMFAGLFIVTGLVICYPVLFYTSGTLYPQTLAAFLFMLALALILSPQGGLIRNLVTGLIFGFLILAVPPFLFTMGVVLVVARYLKVLGWRDVVLMALAASLMVGLWTARNAVCFHRFVPIATNSGVNFMAANNGGSAIYQGAASEFMEPYYYKVRDLGYDEFQSDSFYWNLSLSYLKEHPGNAFLRYLERALNYFNTMNSYSLENAEEISAWKQIVVAVSYSSLLALLGWRLIEVKKFPLTAREKLFLTVYVLTAFTSAIFLTRIRLRLPYDYLIIAVIALHLSRRLEILVASRRPMGKANDLPQS